MSDDCRCNREPKARSSRSSSRIGGGFLQRFSAAVMVVVVSACGGSEALAPVQDVGDVAARQPMGEVQSGDTLYSFAWRYGFDYREIAQWNGLGPPYRLQTGERLRLSPGGAAARGSAARAPTESAHVTAARPPARLADPAVAIPDPAPQRSASARPKTRPQPSTLTTTPKTRAQPTISAPATVASKDAVPPSPKPRSSDRQEPKRWYWPVKGKVVQRFNLARPGGQGIRIAASPDASVVAARGGKVVYVGGGLPGYGKLIIVKHAESLLTAYGYVDRALVKEGEQVKGGQAIATVASNGVDETPVLHFEVRRDGKPTDPLVFLSG